MPPDDNFNIIDASRIETTKLTTARVLEQAVGFYLEGTTKTFNITSFTSTKIEVTFQFSGIDSNRVAVTVIEETFKAIRN